MLVNIIIWFRGHMKQFKSSVPSSIFELNTQSLVLLLSVVLAGCSIMPKPNVVPTSSGRYSISQDTGPSEHRDMSKTPDAIPKVEPLSVGGNKSSYVVWGQRYHVMPSSLGFREQGVASWYGIKFHGHKTSNGEVYDMYAMSAAHKSLPLPSYVRVTNLDNNRVVIVRVNDRGPFHANRIIDLSYAAASKLGYRAKGVATVLVEAIDAQHWTSTGELSLRRQRPLAKTDVGKVAPELNSQPSVATIKLATHQQRRYGHYVQVAALTDQARAVVLQKHLVSVLPRSDVTLEQVVGQKNLIRVMIGPIVDLPSAEKLASQLPKLGFDLPYLIKP
jgi:rare lipoprotein A